MFLPLPNCQSGAFHQQDSSYCPRFQCHCRAIARYKHSAAGPLFVIRRFLPKNTPPALVLHQIARPLLDRGSRSYSMTELQSRQVEVGCSSDKFRRRKLLGRKVRTWRMLIMQQILAGRSAKRWHQAAKRLFFFRHFCQNQAPLMSPLGQIADAESPITRLLQLEKLDDGFRQNRRICRAERPDFGNGSGRNVKR